MPLVRREDSVLVVVDAQPGFFAYDGLSAPDAERAAKAVERTAWMAGLAALLEMPAVVVEEGPQRNGHTDPRILERVPPGTPVSFRAVVVEDAVFTNSAQEHERGLARMVSGGVERNHCKGVAFEWLHTVDRALEDFPQANALGTPPWRL